MKRLEIILALTRYLDKAKLDTVTARYSNRELLNLLMYYRTK